MGNAADTGVFATPQETPNDPRVGAPDIPKATLGRPALRGLQGGLMCVQQGVVLGHAALGIWRTPG